MDISTTESRIVLTARESEVLQLICKGNTINNIACQLFLSPYTIVSHKQNLVKKFQARNIVHLGVLAERYGYVKRDFV